jgi:hypothetical protein
MSTHSAHALSFSLFTLLATGLPGCSSGDSSSTTSSTASQPTGVSAPEKKAGAGAPATTTAAAAAPVPMTLSASCLTKYANSILSCVEYYGKVPEKAEADCKKEDGKFVTGATPCTTDGAVGKCEKPPSDGTKLVEVSYKTSVGDPKGSCEIMGHKWSALGK